MDSLLRFSRSRGTPSRVVYYSDPLKDDFAGTNINTCEVGADFEFTHRSPVWRLGSALLYRLIALPIVGLIGHLGYGLRIKNRRVLRKLRGQGFFIYGNHTQGMMDAFSPSLVAFPRRADVIAGPDVVSIKGLRTIVQMLGAVPIPTELHAMKPFRAAVEQLIAQGHAVALFPEAHIWPYCTGIRPFTATSFSYPVRLGAPCVACCATYRRRRLFRNAPPLMTLTLSEPFYPDGSLSDSAAKQRLRDQVFDFLSAIASSPDNCEYIRYERLPQTDDTLLERHAS